MAGLVLAAWTLGLVALAQRRVGWGVLLGLCYGVVGGLAVLNWLSGEYMSAYSDLFVIWAGTSAVHPPRRSRPRGAHRGGGALDPLHRGPRGRRHRGGRLAAQSLLMIVVGFVLGAILFDVRTQRLDRRGAPEGSPAWTR